MKKVNFNLESYNTGAHDVVTRAGSPVVIAAINPTMGASAIVGWVNGVGHSWSIDGKVEEGETSGIDLFLKEKARKVFINITRQANGEIRVYGTPDIKPRGPYKGAVILKSLEIDV